MARRFDSGLAAPGTVLAERYRLERILGQGGIGVVWEAVQVASGAKVAIKLIKSEHVSRDDARRRFVREAQAAAAVSHPNLVKHHEVISGPGGAPALVMELLEGESLEARLDRQKQLSLAETAWTLLPVFLALRAMHAAKLVHRDLKPANIFLARVPGSNAVVVKLLDFGLVKWIDPTRLGGQTNWGTASGIQIGTPLYMAPEQWEGKGKIDERTDVYAAGVVLFECLSGMRPIEADTPQQIWTKLSEGLPSLSEVWPSAPPEVASLVDGMMVRDVERRVQNLDAAIDILSQHADFSAIPDVPIRIQRQLFSRRRVVGAVFGASLLTLALAVPAIRPDDTLLPARPQLARQIRFDGGTFLMGRTRSEVANECDQVGPSCQERFLERELPQRQITLSPFLLEEREVTNAEYVAFLNADRRILEIVDDEEPPAVKRRYVRTEDGHVLWMDLWNDPEDGEPVQWIYSDGEIGVPLFKVVKGKENEPVVQVTWDAANQFCIQRGMRLPTEAEWEVAARGLTARRYPWGDGPPGCDGVAFGRSKNGPCRDLPYHREPGGAATQDVTPEGVRGLGGNVQEWVWDWFSQYSPCRDPKQPGHGGVDCHNPRVPPDPSLSPGGQYMVVRGGSWETERFVMRTTRRWRNLRTTTARDVGFRCAADAPAIQ